MVKVREYYEILEKNREFFEEAFEIAKDIAEKAKKCSKTAKYSSSEVLQEEITNSPPIWIY